MALLGDKGYRLSIHDVRKRIALPGAVCVEAELLEQVQKGPQAAVHPEVQRLPELLVRQTDHVVYIGLAEGSGPRMDVSNVRAVVRHVVGMDGEIAVDV